MQNNGLSVFHSSVSVVLIYVVLLIPNLCVLNHNELSICLLHVWFSQNVQVTFFLPGWKSMVVDVDVHGCKCVPVFGSEVLNLCGSMCDEYS